MKGLRLQDGCHNCRHRFVEMEHDGEYQNHSAIERMTISLTWIFGMIVGVAVMIYSVIAS